MARMLGEEYVPEDAIGLTDAIRQAFKTNPNYSMNAIGVRERLQQMGLNITKYGNVLASIHTVLERLNRRGEIRAMGTIGNSQGYMWESKLTPPPRPSDVEKSGMRG